MTHSHHFLQSTAWETFQQSLGRTTFRRSGDGWDFLAILEPGTANSRLYCPYGPTVADRTALTAAIAELTQLGQSQQVSFLRIEPVDPAYNAFLSSHKWRKVTYQQLQPEHSHLLDLTQPKEQLIAQMAQPVRNIYRNYHKKGVVVHHSTDPKDIEILLQFVHQVAQRNGIRPHRDDYFRQQAATLFPLHAAQLWYAMFEGQPIAAALFYQTETTLYYAHAGASALPQHRKLNAGTAVLAEAIIDAQQRGLQLVDLYGIAPTGASPDHPWAGFTKFKRSFGGSDVTFAGAWDLPLRPVSYWLYRAYQIIR